MLWIVLIVIVVVLVGGYLFCIKPNGRSLDVADQLKAQRLFAHRGLHDNESEASENSLAAFQRAIDEGYGMEMDVQLTKDEVPVVFHDFTLKRVARNEQDEPVEGKVSDYTLDELQKFHLLKSQEKIPTFASFLSLVNGQVPLIIELKIENSDRELKVCPIVAKMLESYPGLYCIESFNPRGVQWYYKNHPEVMRGQLSAVFTKETKVSGMTWLIYFLSQNLMFNFLTKPDFIAYDALSYQVLSRRLCRTLYHNTAVAWTIRSQQELEDRKEDYDMFIFEHFHAK